MNKTGVKIVVVAVFAIALTAFVSYQIGDIFSNHSRLNAEIEKTVALNAEISERSAARRPETAVDIAESESTEAAKKRMRVDMIRKLQTALSDGQQ